jgi:hypothetical protein
MKKIALILFGLVSSGIALAATDANSALTASEASALQSLGCKPTSYQYLGNGRVLLGNEQGAKRQLFLVKNISNQSLSIDFPEGHIGASAWITQQLNKAEWSTYLYIKGQGLLSVENSAGQASEVRPRWTCTVDNGQSDCQKYLYVCEVTNANANGSLIQQQANTILQNGTDSWWLYQGDGAKAISEVFEWVINSNFVAS